MTPAENLLIWVQLKHKGQLIKHTGEPYFNHLVAVAEMAKTATKFGYEIGLCHDILEDTPTRENEVLEALCDFGYANSEAREITARVVELTDVFTASAYPNLSKKIRKEREAARLVNISSAAQTVKYCDLIDNIQWVLQHDQKHAVLYLKKKKLLLSDMINGDKIIRQRALDIIDKGLAINK